MSALKINHLVFRRHEEKPLFRGADTSSRKNTLAQNSRSEPQIPFIVYAVSFYLEHGYLLKNSWCSHGLCGAVHIVPWNITFHTMTSLSSIHVVHGPSAVSHLSFPHPAVHNLRTSTIPFLLK